VSTSYADRTDTLIKRLRSSRVKTRLSAALVLGKSHDVRSLRALTKTLKGDSNQLVRLAASAGLGSIIPKIKSSKNSKHAIAVLRRAKRNDSSPKVRKRASKILENLEQQRNENVPIRSLWVRVKKPSGEVSRRTQKSIATKVSRLLARQQRIDVGTKSGPIGTRGYVVSSRISFTSSPPANFSMAINCSVSVRASPRSKTGESWRAKESAIATAAAQAVGPHTPSGIQKSKSQCALAAVEAATSRQIIPFLKKQLL
jgi:hypothetical protein